MRVTQLMAMAATATGITTNSTVEIAPGVFMPRVSMGHSDSSAKTSKQVAALWLSLGGRGLDTARSYHNQDQVGAAIRESGLDRSSVFITTKIACAGNASGAAAMIDGDLKMLGYPSVDLLLIHRPNSYPGHPEQCHDPAMIAATWKAMEAAKAAGKARAIGVSNFNSSQLAALLDTAVTPPVVNQCLLSIGKKDEPTISFCQAHDIVYEAYSPLRGGEMSLPAVKAIAAAHGKSGAQVVLRWVLQQGHVLATSADNADYDKEDLDVFSWALTDKEMATLSAL